MAFLPRHSASHNEQQSLGWCAVMMAGHKDISCVEDIKNSLLALAVLCDKRNNAMRLLWGLVLLLQCFPKKECLLI